MLNGWPRTRQLKGKALAVYPARHGRGARGQAMTAQPWVKSFPPGVRTDAPLDLAPVQSVLDKAAERFGPRPALEFMGKRTSYAELEALANRSAAGVQKLGVGPGVQVGLFLPNAP